MGAGIQLTDGRLLLRSVLPEDDQAFYAAVRESIPEISPWMDWCTTEYNLEMARAWAQAQPGSWSSGALYAFAILDARDGVLLGGC